MPSRRSTWPVPWCARSSSSGRRRTSPRTTTSFLVPHVRPTGAALVAFRLTSDSALADDVHALVRGNVDNPTDDISWGAPGTLLAALAMGQWTGEGRWDEAARESAIALRERRGGDGLAPRRRLPRPQHATRRRGKHARSAPFRGRRCRRKRERGRSLTACVLRGRPRDCPARRGRSSRGHETAGSVSNGAPARRVCRRCLGVPRREPPARRRRAHLACGRAPRREGPRPLPRHLGQRLRPPQGVRTLRR